MTEAYKSNIPREAETVHLDITMTKAIVIPLLPTYNLEDQGVFC